MVSSGKREKCTTVPDPVVHLLFRMYRRSPKSYTFELRVSKYITANLFLFPRFDDANLYDDDLGYWQFKEYSSLGLAYTF